MVMVYCDQIMAVVVEDFGVVAVGVLFLVKDVIEYVLVVVISTCTHLLIIRLLLAADSVFVVTPLSIS